MDDPNSSIDSSLMDDNQTEKIASRSSEELLMTNADDVVESVGADEHNLYYIILGSILLLAFLAFYRTWLNKAALCPSQARMTRKVVIITGATSGIGKEITQQMANRGAHVVMGCRDITLGRQIAEEIKQRSDNPFVFVKHLDLSSTQSIYSFVKDITKNHKKLDVLINNAAVLCPPGKHTGEGYETTFMVNYLGHFLLTHLLIDLLLHSKPSRIINVSSHEHTLVRVQSVDDLFLKTNPSSFSTYCRCKLAQILHTAELRNRLEYTGVATYAVHPGLVKTNLRRNIGLLKLPIISVLSEAFQRFFFKSVYEGCQTILYCAIAPELTEQTGLYYSNCDVSTPSVEGMSSEKAAKLWELSEKALNIGMDGLPPEGGSQAEVYTDEGDGGEEEWGWGEGLSLRPSDDHSDVEFDGDEWVEEE